MSQAITLALNPDLVRPLGQVQNEFVQVLLSRFRLARQPGGLTLDVEFGFDTPAIWLRRAKAHVRERLPRERMRYYSELLRRMFVDDDAGGFVHDDGAFPFRFGNGGTLPVIRMGNADYYCLFYRETHPVGWNLANGGAESVSELLDPAATIARELREELIVVEPTPGRRYVFDWNEGRRADHPDFAIARRVWQEIFRKRDFGALEEVALPLKWLPAGDSVVIRFDGQPPIEMRDCLVNINAEDFGIEIDRVAKLSIGEAAVLCDGEVVRGRLLNRVIGLFEVQRLNAAMAVNRTRPQYVPDRIFHSGCDRTADGLEAVVREYLEELDQQGLDAAERGADWTAADPKYGLCPATDTLIRRYLRLEYEQPSEAVTAGPASEWNVFLSFCAEDRDVARQVFDGLRARGRRVFFSDETLHHANFADAVDEALAAARALVVVGTERDRFYKPWVRYEWQSFHNDILAGRKPWNTPLVTLAANVAPASLPRPLAFRQVVDVDVNALQPALDKLALLV